MLQCKFDIISVTNEATDPTDRCRRSLSQAIKADTSVMPVLGETAAEIRGQVKHLRTMEDGKFRSDLLPIAAQSSEVKCYYY